MSNKKIITLYLYAYVLMSKMIVLEIINSKRLQCPDIIFSVGILKCYMTEKSSSYVKYIVIGTITMPS